MPLCGNNEKGFQKIKRLIKEQDMPQPTTNNLEGWEENFREEQWNKRRVVNCDDIVNAIKEIRKHDEDELIKKFIAIRSDYAAEIIKDYYNKNKCICGEINSRNCPIHQ